MRPRRRLRDVARQRAAGLLHTLQQAHHHRLGVTRREQFTGEPLQALGAAGGELLRGLVQLLDHLLVLQRQDLGGGGERLPLGGDAGAAEDGPHPVTEGRRAEDDARALLAGAPGAAAAVGVDVGVARRVGVDHLADVRHVDAARRDVGRHQHAHGALLEGGQGAGAVALLHLPGERGGEEACGGELAGEARGLGAGLHEDQGLVVRVAQQQIHQGVDAVSGRDLVHHVRDVDVGGAEAGALHAHRVLLVLGGERQHVAREGRRDEVGATPLGQLPEDLLQLVAEAEVEHLVGLVEHHRLHLGGVDDLAIEVIAEPPGGTHHDVGAALQLADLERDRGATGDRGDLQLQPLEEPAQLGAHLLGELAGGGDHDGERHALVVRRPGPALELRREHEAQRQRLARAGLRGDAQVAAGERRVEHRVLHRGERGVALGDDGVAQRGGQRGEQVGERHVDGNFQGRFGRFAVGHWRGT